MATKAKRWFTQTTYVDLDTGEVISKSRFERDDYYIVRRSHTYEDCGAYTLKKYTNECKQKGQYELEL